MDEKTLIKFPRFTREENRRCKLTDEQIKEIQELRRSGCSLAELGRMYNVTPQAIFYWCLSDIERQRRIKQSIEMRKLTGYTSPKEYDFKEYRNRKLKHKKYIQYENQFTIEYKRKMRPNFTETRKKSDKKYHLKNKEKYSKYNKIYQKKNLEKYRIYNKKCRTRKFILQMLQNILF